MAPSIQYSLDTEFTGTSASFSVDGGAGISSGDLLLIFLRLNNQRTVTPPAGWTSEEEIDNATAGDRFVFLSKTADGTENGTTITTTFNLAAGNSVGALIAITGGAYDTHDTANATDTAPSVTVAEDDSLELQVCTEQHADSPAFPSTVPSGFTEEIKKLYSGGNSMDCKILVGYKAVDAGASGGDDWGPIGWDAQGTMLTYVAKPAAGGGGTIPSKVHNSMHIGI